MNLLDNELGQNGWPLIRHPLLIMGRLDPGRPIHIRDTEGVTATGVSLGRQHPLERFASAA